MNRVSENLSSCGGLILGVSVFGHDSSCSLVDFQTGNVLYALTEERFSNIKHDGGFPTASLAKIEIEITARRLGEVKHIALNLDCSISIRKIAEEISHKLSSDQAEDLISEITEFINEEALFHSNSYPLNYLEAKLSRLGLDASSVKRLSDKVSWFANFSVRHIKIQRYLQSKYPQAVISPVSHHICHAASAFYCSSFNSASILTIDGQGENETISLSVAEDKNINLLRVTSWPHSLGAFYMQLAWHLGFDGHSQYPGFGDEYKVMGMAAYGKPIFIDVFRSMGGVDDNGVFQFKFDEYLTLEPVVGCPGHSQLLFSRKLCEIIGERRDSTSEITQQHYDIAKSGQLFLEEIGVEIAKRLKEQSPQTENLCVAGGVGLNGLMNMEVLKHAGFRRIFVQPASGDDGTSLGAALYVYHQSKKSKRCAPLPNAYLGLDYTEKAILTELNHFGLKYRKPENLHQELGGLLDNNHIIARYFGRGEFGPRALGHRSILANPVNPDMKDLVNQKVKHRESFRPFAPACLEEKSAEFFVFEDEAPYMLLISKVRESAAGEIPSVVHADGTARLQTLNKTQNEDFYSIVNEFYKRSGIPILLNTSFNVNGEAIVETPRDAIESFLFMGIDYLAIGPYLVSKKDNECAPRASNRQELISNRQDRYNREYFSKEKYLWSQESPVESQLELLAEQSSIYQKAAEERLSVIKQLDSEVNRLRKLFSKDDSREL